MKKIIIIAVCVMFLTAGEAVANQMQLGGNFNTFFSGWFGSVTENDCLTGLFNEPENNFNLLDIFGIFNPPENNTNPDGWIFCDFDLPQIDLSCLDDLWELWEQHGCHPTPPPCSAPEPASLLLFGMGLIGLAGIRIKLRKR